MRTGRALEEIRTRRLYLLTHSSFEAYVRERWGLSHPRGFALCNAGEVANALEEQGDEVDKGGHFPAWEEPEVFAGEVRAAFRSLR